MACYQGIDLVPISKFKRIFAGREDLLEEVFTDRERESCRVEKEPWSRLAERFAVKEACFKALGLGLSGAGIEHLFREVELLVEPPGAARIAVSGWIAAIGKTKRICNWQVAIARNSGYAAAAVVLTAAEPRA